MRAQEYVLPAITLRICGIFWGLGLCAAPLISAGELRGPVTVWRSGINAAASPESTEGFVYQLLTRSSLPARAPLNTCVLIHGYVVSQSRLDGVIRQRESGLGLKAFVDTYFGKELLDLLSSRHCDNVVVTMQEAIHSTALEMTERSERFMAHIGCAPEKPCAVFGHSKGGLVVTSMARRCMQETSLAGETACRGIAKFYSASGNNLGAVYGALLYGLYASDPYHPKLEAFERRARLSGIDVAMSGPESMEYTAGKTNPIWVDISPIAPMEHGVPVAVANLVKLNHAGWLTGDYAASDSDARWQQGQRPPSGCGAWTDFMARWACAMTGRSTAAIHDPDLKPYLERGLELWRSDPRFLSERDTDYLSSLSWETHQEGDGMADTWGALGVCRLGGSAVKGCALLGPVNHAGTAGSGPAVRADLSAFLNQ